MTPIWHRGGRLTPTCGYCVPLRPIGVGEWYVLVGARPFVRCAWCATTRMGLELPVELQAADGDPAADGEEAARPADPLDWKRRAAGDA